MQTTTLNWDTVYAVPIDIVNEAIKFKHPTPEQFELLDGKYGDCKGSFQEWQIISGEMEEILGLKFQLKILKLML
ncbi:hypothetical protein JQ031_04305 [Clostridium botulinum]|nr:hypothetical protein [Clostridium botulinum]MCS4472778.1 hypothetical protein [Clostridium botulinum]